LHAEENAILYAAKNKTSLEGATLYVTLSPCLACARIIYTTASEK
jgi:dCMP deaminase